MRLKLFFILILLSKITFSISRLHGGYISYSPMGNGVYKFRICIWTNPQDSMSEYCDLTLFVDGIDTVYCPRVNGTTPFCPNGGNGLNGVIIVPPNGSYGGVKESIYEGIDTLLPGAHIFSIIDPNYDANIQNLNNSVNRSFAIIDTLYLYNTNSGMLNNAPVVNYAPIDNVCLAQPFHYNPGVTELDGDSLDFSITFPYEGDASSNNSVAIMSDETTPSGITIDKHTGLLSWNSPQQSGEYVISILIKEYRRDPNNCGHVYLIGETLLTTLIYVTNCPALNFTFNSPPQNTCITSGNTYGVQANVTSSGITLPLNISAVGLPLTSNQIGNNATFNFSSVGNSASSTFNWTPSCNAVQLNPFPVTIKTFDASIPPNANYETFFVNVISPPPTNLIANNNGTSVTLNWNAPINCNQISGDTIQNYFIYRVDSCINFVPASCQTGVSATAEYLNIGTTSSSVTTFTDTNPPPVNMCTYIIAAHFSDCSMSKASSGVCAVTGIENNLFTENISISPNPTNGNINLKVNLNRVTNLKISISNSLGQMIYYKIENNINNGVFEYDLSSLSKGIYFATIRDDNNNITVKKICIE